MKAREGDCEKALAVGFTLLAKAEYRQISSEREIEHVNRVIDLLANMPRLGHVYEPDEDTAFMPIEVRVFYTGRHGVYYTLQEERNRLLILSIADQRGDPRQRYRRLRDTYA